MNHHSAARLFIGGLQDCHERLSQFLVGLSDRPNRVNPQVPHGRDLPADLETQAHRLGPATSKIQDLEGSNKSNQ